MNLERARPLPPDGLLELDPEWEIQFAPAPHLEAWIRWAFIGEGRIIGPPLPTVNPDHCHLTAARIGVLWTNGENRKGMKRVGATVEMPMSQGDAWKRGRFQQQLREWFGEDPDFVLTFDATLAAQMNDVSFCAMCEHELYHCAQKLNKWGLPAFSKTTGLPQFAIQSHDVEEFTGVMARYGVEACAGDSKNFVKAANQTPLFARAHLNCICGTCGR